VRLLSGPPTKPNPTGPSNFDGSGLPLTGGTQARAVIVVDDRESSAIGRLKLDAFADMFEEPLYQLRFVTGRKRGHRDRLDGFGPFHDLRQLVMFEVAR
jgi:hypothetical protein